MKSFLHTILIFMMSTMLIHEFGAFKGFLIMASVFCMNVLMESFRNDFRRELDKKYRR